jgi:BirA family biotin operon repressor/biotin-[acetyl-CoA-carboxylase] ligase
MHTLTEDAIKAGLRTRRVGRRIIVTPEVDSTNTHALQHIAAEMGPDADGTVVFAERQTAGRGRLGRAWHSPTGASLLFTAVLWEMEPLRCVARWMMAAAVSVVRGIEAATDVSPTIRWPNDVCVGGRKLAGILVETRKLATSGRVDAARGRDEGLAVAIGVGVNCLQHVGHFPGEIRSSATSLELETSQPVDRALVAREILEALEAVLCDSEEAGDSRLAALWAQHSADIGTRVTLASGGECFSGHILDIEPSQGLLLQLDTGARRHFDPSTTTRL